MDKVVRFDLPVSHIGFMPGRRGEILGPGDRGVERFVEKSWTHRRGADHETRPHERGATHTFPPAVPVFVL
jgi:hypothetical protein